MRTLIAVLGLLLLVSIPAPAAWTVTLTTGEVLTVESYWRDGEKTHLLRGGVDIIVDTARIASMEDGAPEPETGVQNATARRSDAPALGAEAAAPGAAAPSAAPAESIASYRTRLEAMTPEEIAAEQRRVTKEVLRVQAARFEAKFGGKPKEEVQALDREFKSIQQRQIAADAKLKELVGP